MSATHPEDSAVTVYVREQIARIDLMQERIVRLREETQPRIDALLAQAEKDRAMAAKDRAVAAKELAQARINWSAIIGAVGTGLSGFAALIAVLIAAHIL